MLPSFARVSVAMAILHHYPLCPHSRFIRLVCAELGVALDFVEERPWERRESFLALDPAGNTPVFVAADGLIVPGAGTIAEYLDETREPGMERLMPGDPAGRVEVRRLMAWFSEKFFAEVTGYLVHEKVYKRFVPASAGGGPPDMPAIRAARANVRYHLRYLGYLINQRKWLAGDALTYADLAAAAHLSCVDYLGDAPWNEDETARDWYARMKSRPAFRALLADRVPGMAPPDHYANPDF
ncbi:MAG: Gst family glutathione S-transferase [Saliniramus fredricksonii]|uniref:Glutathione S-transferase n=2 Tax=Saliniramus fredricksonii TaxID=1653334 RepID=A0A0P7X2V7_9HYPH|nr:MAG: Gst family glutathione S-transferase [Saliniramus fredricksonii]SCC78612.1 glutathione S-transferase [Saliniramus fredricksonii]